MDPFPIEDLYEKHKHLFSDTAQAVLDIKCLHQVHQKDVFDPNINDYVRQFDLVRCMGFTVKHEDIEIAVELIADAINEMVEENAISGCLAPVFTTHFEKLDSDERYIVVCYVAVDSHKEKEMLSRFKAFFFDEGALPGSLKEVEYRYFCKKFNEEFEALQ